jgi:hypothetical protein
VFADVRTRLKRRKTKSIIKNTFTSVLAQSSAAGQFVGTFVGIAFFGFSPIPTDSRKKRHATHRHRYSQRQAERESGQAF